MNQKNESLLASWKEENQFFFVSIGTGNPISTKERGVVPYSKVKRAGKMQWANYIFDLMMDGSKHLADGQVELMFPHHGQEECPLKSHYIRLQVDLKPEDAHLDNASPANVAKLEAYAYKLIEDSKDEIDLIIHTLTNKDHLLNQ